MAIPRKQPGNYPAILSCGFRLFFLIGSVWGGLTALVWLQIISGRVETASLLLPVDCAFLLTAPLRLAAVFLPEATALLRATAMLWIAAMLGYAVRYDDMLASPRLQPRRPNRLPT